MAGLVGVLVVLGGAVGFAGGCRAGVRWERGLWLKKAAEKGVDVSAVRPTRADV